jgi:hypothetical protein
VFQGGRRWGEEGRHESWLPDPISTVRVEHIRRELTAVAMICVGTMRRLSDRKSSVAVDLGNHPIGVSHQQLLRADHWKKKSQLH